MLQHLLTFFTPLGKLFIVVLALLCWPAWAGSDVTMDPHAIIQQMTLAYDGIRDYTALLLRRERINGTLLPLEKIELRFQEPFKVYMAWQEPYAGRIVTFTEGENNNKLLVNPGGILGFVRLSLDPEGSLATRGSHYSIRQVGLRNTIVLLSTFYQRGIREEKIAVYFRGMGDVDGRPAYQLEWQCTAAKALGCYAYRAELWVDTEHYLPTRMRVYNGDNQLYEHYEYHHLQLNPGLDAEAFTMPALPEAPVEDTNQDESASP